MADSPMLPPDKGTPHRVLVTRWDRLWKGDYDYGSASRNRSADAAPGYTRSFSLLVAGLFQRQPPTVNVEDGPLTPTELSGLLHETVSKSAGYGAVLIRPVSDGERWQPSVLAPSRFAVSWAHRRAT